MERKATELPDEKLLEGENLTEEFFLVEKLHELISENKIAKKTVEELKQDEETFNSYLNKLKKENFRLEATVNAWKTTLRNKLEEFKEADLKLDEIHSEIQTEREEFCGKLDKFNDEHGVLSDWWDKQMNFLSELENLEEKNSQQEKCKEEIKKLEEEIEEIKKQIQQLQAETQVEVDVHLTQEGEPFVRSHEIVGDVPPGRVEPKEVRIVENDDQIIYEGQECEIGENFYPMVDVEKVRMANKRRNRQKAFFHTIKKLITL